MKQIDWIPKIIRINQINGYKVFCLFDNMESRTIDFEVFFKNCRNFSEKHPAYKLLQYSNEFNQIEVMENTIGWRNVGIYSENIRGEKVFYPFDLDPIMLFKNSELEKELF